MSDKATVTLSAVCDACATTLQRVPRLPVEFVGGWAALRLEWWQFTQRVCEHNNAGIRFVMQFEEPDAKRGVCSACGHPMNGYKCPNPLCLTNDKT